MARSDLQPIAWWHLLSLDAPTVAAVWCWVFGRYAGLRLPRSEPAMLAMGTWLLYVADRLLDGQLAASPGDLRERHLFHQRFRVRFVSAWIAVALLLGWLVLTRMPRSMLRAYLALSSVAFVYLLLVHLPSLRVRFSKELVVGVVFACATAVPAWCGGAAAPQAGPHSRRTELLPAILLFAGLCSLNCMAIERWEGLLPENHPPSCAESAPAPATLAPATLTPEKGPHTISHWAGRHLGQAAALTATGAGALFCYTAAHGARSRSQGAVAASLAASALLFPLLSRSRHRISPLTLRAAADAALLTPLLFLRWLRQ